MSPYLAIHILVVGSLFSTLASFPETTNLALEESPISKYLTAFSIGPAVTNTRTSISSLAEATGYFSIVVSADSLCKTPLVASVVKLNNCQYRGENLYSTHTATSSTFGYAEYSDSQCKDVVRVLNLLSYTSGVCSNKVIHSITSTDKWTTDLSTLVQR